MAAALIDTLHAALVVDPEQCRHLLLNAHKFSSADDKPEALTIIRGGLDPAMRALQGHLAAQLTAGACLARLCTQVGISAHVLRVNAKLDELPVGKAWALHRVLQVAKFCWALQMPCKVLLLCLQKSAGLHFYLAVPCADRHQAEFADSLSELVSS